MRLEQERIHPVLYWNNPNIHPLLEYKSRLDAMQEYARREHLPLIVSGEYGLRPFTKAVSKDPDSRCDYCYAVRLRAAAAHAREHGFDGFSTTLMISPYQDLDQIVRLAEEAAEESGVPFVRYDFQPFFRAGQEKVRGMNLYMQKYCGCVYSEEERYERKKSRLPQGFDPNFEVPAKKERARISKKLQNPDSAG